MAAGTVAIILDAGGGFRVVVTDEPHTLSGHVGEGERLIVVPDAIVDMPVDITHAEYIVGMAERHLKATRP